MTNKVTLAERMRVYEARAITDPPLRTSRYRIENLLAVMRLAARLGDEGLFESAAKLFDRLYDPAYRVSP